MVTFLLDIKVLPCVRQFKCDGTGENCWVSTNAHHFTVLDLSELQKKRKKKKKEKTVTLRERALQLINPEARSVLTSAYLRCHEHNSWAVSSKLKSQSSNKGRLISLLQRFQYKGYQIRGPNTSTRVFFGLIAQPSPHVFISKRRFDPTKHKAPSVTSSLPVFDWWEESGRNLDWMFWCA